jgi:hypothetical protein
MRHDVSQPTKPSSSSPVDIRALAASHREKAIEGLLSIARNEKAGVTARRQAARALRDHLRQLPDDISKLLEK